MLQMAKLKVPIISIIIGEGSSGGALALGVGNKVVMLENAVYSILSPEGYASILWKDSSRAKEAAEKMKLTAQDLLELNVIDKVIDEIDTDTEDGFKNTALILKVALEKYIDDMEKKEAEIIVQERYEKFRNMGEYIIL